MLERPRGVNVFWKHYVYLYVLVKETNSTFCLWPLLFPSISRYLDKADWFLKADDDTYVIVENLRLLLSRFSPDQPVYLGRRFRRFVHQGYMSGGAGYVLSRESVSRYVRALHHGTCSQSTSAEDLLLGFCLQKLGVPAGDSRDLQHRETFHPLWLGKLLSTEDTLPKWFHQYNYYPSKVVSRSTLSTTHIKWPPFSAIELPAHLFLISFSLSVRVQTVAPIHLYPSITLSQSECTC